MKYLCLLLLLLPINAVTKDLYVSTTGNDSTTYANNDIDNSWLTPLKAWTEADSGDTVFFRAGTYSFSTQINTKTYGNVGTEANPIIFMSYPTETATLTYTGSAGALQVGAAVVIEKDWNIMKNFNLNGPSTFFMFRYDLAVDGGQVSGCTYNMSVGGDNVGFVVSSSASNITVDNNRITCPGSGAHNNTAGLLALNSEGFKALNNETTNCRTGIYYKHGHTLPAYDTGIKISGNYIEGADLYCMQLNLAYADISNNICGSGNGYLRTFESNGGPRSDHNTFDHNTVYGTSLFLADDASPGAQYNTYTNNILTTKAQAHPYESYALESAFDYNIYPTGDAVVNNSTNHTLPAWVIFYGQDGNSIAGAVTYEAGASPSSIAGYALTPESLGYQAGSDGKDMGANVSLVGVGNLGASIGTGGMSFGSGGMTITNN